MGFQTSWRVVPQKGLCFQAGGSQRFEILDRYLGITLPECLSLS